MAGARGQSPCCGAHSHPHPPPSPIWEPEHQRLRENSLLHWRGFWEQLSHFQRILGWKLGVVHPRSRTTMINCVRRTLIWSLESMVKRASVGDNWINLVLTLRLSFWSKFPNNCPEIVDNNPEIISFCENEFNYWRPWKPIESTGGRLRGKEECISSPIESRFRQC
jgi:hypothetical protein